MTCVRSTAAAFAIALLACSGCSSAPSDGAAGLAPADRAAPTTTVAVPTTSPDTASPDTASSDTSSPVSGAYSSAIVHEVVDGADFDDIERRLTARITQVGLPGASLLVVQHGELIEQEAWVGYDLDTQVAIASASKWLTAATIMTLVDEGLIDLDASLDTYAPQMTGTVGTITMRELLSFTSGLVDDDRLDCDEDPTVTLFDCAVEFVRAGVVHEPGAAFRYGSEHLLVAGAIAELVTGQSFQSLFRERIAEPLQMEHTWFLQVGGAPRPIDEVDHPMPAGSAVSTLGDYARFLEMIMHDGVAPDGARILSVDALREMQHDQIAGARYASASEFRMRVKTPYGLGEWLDVVDAGGDGVVISSDGAFGFRPWIDRANDLFGVYLVEDRGQGYVAGDPGATTADRSKVATSGPFVFDWVADAVS